MRKFFNWIFGIKATETQPAEVTPKTKSFKIDKGLLAQSRREERKFPPIQPFNPIEGVVPKEKLASALALDATPYDYVNQNESFAYQFVGYPRLAHLSQINEYRNVVSVMAEEMTRKWIKVITTGDEDKSDKIAKITDALARLKVQEVFKQTLEHDGFYGRGQIYIETKMPSGALSTDEPNELATPLSLSDKKIKKGALVAFRAIEPMWTYPQAYQSQNPLASDYFKPSGWYVMGKAVHSTRLLTLVLRPVADMLKPSYNFGGIPLTQLIEAYVNNWQRTRDSVSDLVHSFSLTVLKTNMQNVLTGQSGESLFDRIDLFNNVRDNRGAMAVDMESEDVVQINTPISGMDALQAQAQEQLASAARIPLVKLLGDQPSGLNASSDGVIRMFYDSIHSLQNAAMLEPIKRILSLIQLSEFGEIDESITFNFVPLYQLTEAEEATVRKTEAETDSAYIQSGVLAADEVRVRLANDKESIYHGIDVNAEIDDPNDEEAKDANQAQDAAFNESDHPRQKDGKFGSKGTSSYVDSKNNERSGGLIAQHRKAESHFYKRIEKNPQKLIGNYLETNKNLIDPDKVKELSREFKDDKSFAAAVHEPSSKLAKMIFNHVLEAKEQAGDKTPVIFSAGGSGSGKSSTLPVTKKLTGAKDDAIVYDSVMGSAKSSIKRIDTALEKQSGDIVIAYTNADPIRAMELNAKRERTVSIETLAHAHAGASNTIHDLAEHYKDNPRVKIQVINNQGSLHDIHEGNLNDVNAHHAELLIEKMRMHALSMLQSGIMSQRKYDLLMGNA